MTRENELQVLRRAYAKQIVHAARASDPRLEKALAELCREEFLSVCTMDPSAKAGAEKNRGRFRKDGHQEKRIADAGGSFRCRRIA
jgi:hypothetical protein